MTQKNDGGWCECAECGRRFGGLRGFDDHRVMLRGAEYDWRCSTDEELAATGYAQDPRGTWRDYSRGARPTPEGGTRSNAEAESALD